MPDTENQNLDPEVASLLGRGEDLTLEFKSDVKALSDRDLIAAVVALANTEGGMLLLGVEDDGTVTGLHASHQDLTALPALIANRTIPSLSVRVSRFDFNGHTLAQIAVPKSRQLVSTSDGLLQRRRLMANGRPEAVPFYPHEFTLRQASLGLNSATPAFPRPTTFSRNCRGTVESSRKGRCAMRSTHATRRLRTCVLNPTHMCVETCVARVPATPLPASKQLPHFRTLEL